MKIRCICTVGALALLIVGSSVVADKPPPPSITDYLASRHRESTLEARREMWKQFRPGETYRGTLQQNIQLRGLLLAEEYAPTVTLSADSFAPGEPVVLVVSGEHAATGAESSLRMQSLAVVDNRLDAGKAAVGVYGCRVYNDFGSTQVQIVLWPSGDRLAARLATSALPLLPPEQAVELMTGRLNLAEADVRAGLNTDPALVERFYAGLTAELVKASFKKAGKCYLADPSTTVAATNGAVVCTLAVAASAATADPLTAPVAGPVAGLAVRGCLTYVGDAAVDVFTATLLQAVEDHPILSAAEKKQVCLYVRVIYGIKALVSVGKSLGAAGVKETCDAAEAAFKAIDAMSEVVENDKVAMTLRVVSAAGGKYTWMVCEVARKTP